MFSILQHAWRPATDCRLLRFDTLTAALPTINARSRAWVLLTDQMSNSHLLSALRTCRSAAVTMLLVREADVHTAVAAMKEGAADYLVWGDYADPDELVDAIYRAGYGYQRGSDAWHPLGAERDSPGRVNEIGPVVTAMVDNIDLSVSLGDQHRRLLFMNRLGRQLTVTISGREPQPGDDIVDYVASRRRDMFIERYDRVLAGETILFESRVSNPDEPLMWVRFRYEPVRDRYGQVRAVCSIAEDITESFLVAEAQEKQKEQLRQSQSLLNTAGSIAAVGGWEVKLKPREVFWTDQMYDLHEVARDTPASIYKAEQFFAPSVSERVNRAFDRLRRDGTEIDLQLPFVSAAGTERWVRLIGRADEDAHGRLLRMYGVMQDITHVRTYEESLSRALRKQQTLNRMRARFVSMVSHEFRTPLSIIQSVSEMLNAYFDRMTVEQRRHRFAKIKTQIDHMVSMIDDVVAIGRFEENQVDFQPQLLSVSDLCAEITAEFQENTAVLNPIRFERPTEPLLAPIDKRLLRQALSNLIGNAVKYSAVDAPVVVTVQRDNDEIHILVSDQGIGIPPAEQEHLFRPFYRAANVSNIKGTGLGLAIVQRTVAQHNGRVDIESTLNVGTTFIIRLPIDPSQSPL